MTASVCGIAVEQIESIHEGRTDNRIATDADRGGLADSALRQLMDCFIGERARARDDANISFLVNGGRHDADLALSRRDDPRAIRSDQARAPVLQELPGFDHVKGRECLR